MAVSTYEASIIPCCRCRDVGGCTCRLAAPPHDGDNAETVSYLAVGEVLFCREAIISTEADHTALSVRLAPFAARQLADETAAHVEKSLIIRLGNAVLVDDLVIHEPISGGPFQFFGNPPSTVLKMQEAMKIPCPKSK